MFTTHGKNPTQNLQNFITSSQGTDTIAFLLLAAKSILLSILPLVPLALTFLISRAGFVDSPAKVCTDLKENSTRAHDLLTTCSENYAYNMVS